MQPHDVETALRIYKQSAAAAEPVGDRDVRFVASTSEPDREGDVVVTAGIETDAYQKNPVIPFAHDYRSLPIGRAIEIQREPTRLLVTVRFAPAEANPMAQQVLDLVRGGFLSAMSIGFRPLEWKYDETRKGINFYRTELLECSVAVVPANASALVAASARGIDTRVLRAWAARTWEGQMMTRQHDGPGLLIRDADPTERVAVDPVALAEAIRDAVGDVVARATYIAICEASGRVPDDDWTPPRRTRSVASPPRLGPLGRVVVLTETGMQQATPPGAFRR